jgi:hypothetical protein
MQQSRATQIIVVERNQDTVFGSLKIEFQIIDTHFPRQEVRRSGFLWGKIGGAAVGDDSGARNSQSFRQCFSSGPAIHDNADPET